MEKPYLHFSAISKTFINPDGKPYPVIEGFDLLIAKGEFVSIIGHSGCGKSTILMMAAGLLDVKIGGIILENKVVDEPGPDRAVVFQSPSLLPWLSALDNVRLGVERVFPHATKAQRLDICKYYLTKVGLGNDLHKKASELSNGMKQRVGIARAFALKPKLLLLDEPFGMLDSLTRAALQEVLLEVWNTEKITAIMITHDVDEALFLSDRVVMMTSGPRSRVGDVLRVPFDRPRHKATVMEHSEYYPCRGHLMSFLEDIKKHTAKPALLHKISLERTVKVS
jgi:nitrate ABC transporter ATP-binding subunit